MVSLILIVKGVAILMITELVVMKKAQEDAKVLRKLREETPKAKLGKAILKIHNIETILKTKIKDIFK